MTVPALTPAQRLKLEIFEKGISVTPGALTALTDNESRQLVEHDYVTTGGLTVIIDDDVYVNAPVDYSFCDAPAAELAHDGAGFILHDGSASFGARVLPLPAYLHPRDSAPRGIMTHADRIRISPIDGCACACRFCDWPLLPYECLGLDVLMKGLEIALADVSLPPRHVLVSGGTPKPRDREFMTAVYEETVRSSPLPVDVMLMPRDGHDLVDRLVAAGVSGLSINLEIYDREVASRLCPNKQGVGLRGYAQFIGRAVELTGGRSAGRVRSLLLVGLEPLESTLEGVRFLAELGCDPVLSPFRPAAGTALADVKPPSAALMEEAYLAAREIVAEHGVELGPRCIPCQHNTIAFPTGAAFSCS